MWCGRNATVKVIANASTVQLVQCAYLADYRKWMYHKHPAVLSGESM